MQHQVSTNGLLWDRELGVGHHPFDGHAVPYDADYYMEMQKRNLGSLISNPLHSFRITLVNSRVGPEGMVCDVGVGLGTFITTRPNTVGFDISPVCLEWLDEQNKFHDFLKEPVDNATFWDCLEHIPDPGPYLAQVRKFLFVTLPIFRGRDHAIASKHFKPGEHCWYFTERGFRQWIRQFGFEVEEFRTDESTIGREDVGSFVCRRKSKGIHAGNGDMT